MEFTQEELNKIELYSEMLMSSSDMAIMLEVDANDLYLEITDKNTEAYKSHNKGYLKTVIKSRKKLLVDAETDDDASSKLHELVLNYKSQIKQ